MHTLPPPRGPSPLIPLAAILGLVVGLLLPRSPARADDLGLAITGFRIEMQGCSADGCQPVMASREPWKNRQACAARAKLLVARVGDFPVAALGLGAGRWEVSDRCNPVLGPRSA